MTERFKLPAAVFLFLTRDSSVLLLRRTNTGWHDGDYDLVAGHIDGDESLTTALARETKEEIGVEFAPMDAVFKHLIHAKFEDGREYFNVIFAVTKWAGEPKIQETDKSDDLRWFSLDELPENLTPSARQALSAIKSGALYSEFGFIADL
jgi:8-oxo-dGTP diphosphatase